MIAPENYKPATPAVAALELLKVNMSESQLDHYLECLTERGLLERVLGKASVPLYVTTEQGKAFLTHIEALVEALGAEEQVGDT